MVKRLKLTSDGSFWHSALCSMLDNVHCLVLYLPAYFWGIGFLQGRPLDQAHQKLLDEWTFSYLTCSAFWIPYMWLNYLVVPATQRVRFMIAGNFAWSVAIDYIAHRSGWKQKDAGGQGE